ncbi:hypothetical protein HN51_012270 [Arachis hypogaea]|uniref:RING-type domain-containing protein n=2 Tax=Arachis hypogaea TaxID=3818 RepID=A0A445DVC3_ARAHY|nr:uncharacterized protein At4g10930 isoform X1 [Arachis hypogaea]QHO57736.1 uncharacterized protein DS421_3g84800 [Arachis hypogaea]RYR67138.1 hypothetical protein Ahy_A03g013391 [Arachis hypogaea]
MEMELEAEAEADFMTNDMLTLPHDPFDPNHIHDDDNLAIEGERCGICMDIVIDRGVLDCCQHWFCFVCIDNWATITNLCPLCQNEFQLITCVPVYDTIGGNKVEDDSFSRDDEWSIEGKNNTLSFPSYYIDENAVTCLDGDGCKVRSGLETIEGDSDLDTSIACDSCDTWYHAFCVGFDTEGTSESTWLCPRCVVGEVSKGRDTDSMESTMVECNPEHINNQCQAEDSFSRKVCVSVADAGETAVVVSMVDGHKWVPSTSEKSLLPLELGREQLTASCILDSDTTNQQKAMEKKIMSPIVKEQELELCLSHNVSGSLSSKSLEHNDRKESAHGARSGPSNLDETKLADESHVKTSPSRNESDMGLHLGLSVGSFLSVDNVDKDGIKDHTTGVKHLSSDECSMEGDVIENDVKKDNTSVTAGKRKHVDHSNDGGHLKVDGDVKPELPIEVSQKKIRAAGGQMTSINNSADAQLSDNGQKSSALNHSASKEVVRPTIMNIVKGTNRRLSKGPTGTNSSDNVTRKDENMAGLRVKKIMKRVADDGESSLIVQNLRKEIREAVRNKSSINFEGNIDTKLLAAFRVAIAGPKTEPVNKLTPSALKAKKSMLQKGTVREHLTKKIFGTSNGKRKRAWDRDCEIEFWKYRCMRATRPEKIETLKSVLDLLRKNSESTQGPECQAKDTILSRLYLADTSVFPRKDDVKPLSVLKTDASSEQTKQNNPSGTDIKNLSCNARVCSSETKVDKKIIHGSASDNSASRKTSVSSSAGAKVNAKELGLKSDSTKSDKKKWALEFLAKKTAADSKRTANGSQEDNALFKDKFPLLAQLPADMRPVLGPSCHNKIPISVRQTQLYRLTERLLRNTNLPVIRRTADTELAVADAINIEKEVADRSSSKLVYLNLCSQELRHRANNTKSDVAEDTNPPESPAKLPDQLEHNADDCSTDPAVEALKNAGLLSDSPPSSPHDNREIGNENDTSGPDNILELDSHPELDIYGDFEYDLEDEDYIGVSKVLNPKPEESDSKVKLVFSTMNSKSDTAVDDTDCKGSLNSEVLRDASGSTTSHIETVPRDSATDAEIGRPSASVSSELCESAVEPADSEFEELYGPDKEPLIKKFPDAEPRTTCGEGKKETPSEATDKSNVSETGKNSPGKEEKSDDMSAKQSECDSINHVTKKVEAYIKEHMRPLCKSGVITAEQYRWAVAKTTEKVMKYHCKAKNANFLIKEGEKVKKLAEQYAEAAQQNRKN